MRGHVAAERVRERDARDANRKTAPLVAAADAVTIDSSRLGLDDVIAAVLAGLLSLANAITALVLLPQGAAKINHSSNQPPYDLALGDVRHPRGKGQGSLDAVVNFDGLYDYSSPYTLLRR